MRVRFVTKGRRLGDLRGRRAMVTGGRVEIGFRLALGISAVRAQASTRRQVSISGSATAASPVGPGYIDAIGSPQERAA